MATVLWDLERPSILDRPSEREAPRAPLSERLRAEREAVEPTASAARVTELAGPRRGGEATLDDLLVGAWEGLSARRSVACPVCSAAMAPRVGAAGGACGDCGSQLR
jgi:hypothetical protein